MVLHAPSRVYCIMQNPPTAISLVFESRIDNFPKTLLLVSWAKIQYTRDL